MIKAGRSPLFVAHLTGCGSVRSRVGHSSRPCSGDCYRTDLAGGMASQDDVQVMRFAELPEFAALRPDANEAVPFAGGFSVG